MTSHFDESIIMGMRAISGSEAIKFKKYFMAFRESSMPSSIFISITCAPFSTCCRATETASSNFSSIISRAKALEPVTFVRSPTLINSVSSFILSGSSPESLVNTSCVGTILGGMFSNCSAIALI